MYKNSRSGIANSSYKFSSNKSTSYSSSSYKSNKSSYKPSSYKPSSYKPSSYKSSSYKPSSYKSSTVSYGDFRLLDGIMYKNSRSSIANSSYKFSSNKSTSCSSSSYKSSKSSYKPSSYKSSSYKPSSYKLSSYKPCKPSSDKNISSSNNNDKVSSTKNTSSSSLSEFLNINSYKLNYNPFSNSYGDVKISDGNSTTKGTSNDGIWGDFRDVDNASRIYTPREIQIVLEHEPKVGEFVVDGSNYSMGFYADGGGLDATIIGKSIGFDDSNDDAWASLSLISGEVGVTKVGAEYEYGSYSISAVKASASIEATLDGFSSTNVEAYGKVALIEGSGSVYIPIPFTDTKLEIGVTGDLGSLGGGAGISLEKRKIKAGLHVGASIDVILGPK